MFIAVLTLNHNQKIRLPVASVLILLKSLIIILCLSLAGQALPYSQRVLCGASENYTDSHGYTWLADQAYTAGNWGYTNAGQGGVTFYDHIENAYDWPLYQNERWGTNVNYRFDVPGPGTYFIKLLLTENWFGVHVRDGIGNGIGERIFNIKVNGQERNNYDILSHCGGRAARANMEVFEVELLDGDSYSIEIETNAVIENAKINAIEVSAHPTLTDTIDYYGTDSLSNEETFRINCGGLKSLDPDNTLWMADENYYQRNRWGHVNGTAHIKPPYAWSISQAYRMATWQEGGKDFEYRISLPNGQYRVTLYFSENEFTSVGERIFDVAIEERVLVSAMDVFQQSGYRTIHKVSDSVLVYDELMTISFPRVLAGKAMISAIEINVINLSDNAFLDFVEKRAVEYFIQSEEPYLTVNSSNGMVIDHTNNFTSMPWGTIPVSVAGLGFRLAVLCAAQARGWLGHNTAEEQVNKLLTFMNNAQEFNDGSPAVGVTQKQGFYFHLLNSDGTRSGTSELSSIDSALFFAGLIIAKQAFENNIIKNLAQSILNRANWQWFVNNDPHGFVSMQWMPPSDPQAGFQNRWDNYNEGVLLDLVGLASETFPLEPTCWYQMGRHWQQAGNFPHMIENSPWAPLGLFTHIFPQCFIDLRDTQDDKNNYFKNTRLAVYANQAFCHAKPEVDTYSQGGWGLSDGFTPIAGYSYRAYGPNPNSSQGTVNPNIVGAAVAFAPEIAIPALRRMFFKYKHFLWGRFGFADGYNLNAPQTLDSHTLSDQGWVAADVVVLNLGALILGIDNHRTGYVWSQSNTSPMLTHAKTRIGMGTQLIDNFENDQSLDDEYDAKDGQWWASSTTVYKLQEKSGLADNTSTFLQIDYNKKEGEEWSYIALQGLHDSANMSYFDDQSQISIEVMGQTAIMLKFKDMAGHESGDSIILSNSDSKKWVALNWSLDNFDWQNCDPKTISEMMVFIEPGKLANGICALDNVYFGSGIMPTPTPTPLPIADTAEFYSSKIMAYPNPAKDNIWITWPDHSVEMVEVEIYNFAGERLSVINETKPHSNRLNWKTDDLAPGIYLYRVIVTSQGQIKPSKFYKIAIIR